MKDKKVLQKIVIAGFVVLILLSLIVPAIFSQTTLSAPKQEKLLNGLRVLMWPDAKASSAAIRIRIHTGSAFDPQGKEGLMQLLADNIFPNEASREFFAEDLGGRLDVISNFDYIEISASSKPDSFLTMLETIATAVANPAIDKETTARIRTALHNKVTTREADPIYLADQAVARRLFGTFPYGRPEDGSTGSVQTIDFADLVEAKARFLTADNATIAVSGNFDRDLGFRAIRRYFGAWLKSDRKVPSTFRQPDEPQTALLSLASPVANVPAVRFATRGVARNEKDFAASVLFTSILETRLKARVPAIHSKDLFVRNEVHFLPGIITIGLAADKSDIGQANGKIQAQELVGKALSDPISDAEFQSAKSQFQAIWAKRDAPTTWLDVDTYKLASADADYRIADNVTIADLTAYAEKLRKQPVVAVVLNSPPAK